jgi:hypothetical protein
MFSDTVQDDPHIHSNCVSSQNDITSFVIAGGRGRLHAIALVLRPGRVIDRLKGICLIDHDRGLLERSLLALKCAQGASTGSLHAVPQKKTWSGMAWSSLISPSLVLGDPDFGCIKGSPLRLNV